MKRYAVAALAFFVLAGSDEIALSRGPANPADIGSRCAVMAGRDDRAYLNCGEPARNVPKASDAIHIDRPFTDHPGYDGRPPRPDPLRSR